MHRKTEVARLVTAVVAGVVVGWLIATPPPAIAEIRWLDLLTAFGTLAAAVVAAWLGVREVLIRREERGNRAAFAQGCLWPEFRRYLAAIERLQKLERRQDASRPTEPASVLTERLEIQQWVREAVRDLQGEDFSEAVAILANVQHAKRHLGDLLARGYEYPNGNSAKVGSVTTAIKKARSRIVPLVRKWRVQ